MGLKADVTFGPSQAGMSVDPMADVREVGIDDRHAVEDDFDIIAIVRDLVAVPLARGFQALLFCGDEIIDRAAELPWLEVLVPFVEVIEDLDFQAGYRFRTGVAPARSLRGRNASGPANMWCWLAVSGRPGVRQTSGKFPAVLHALRMAHTRTRMPTLR